MAKLSKNHLKLIVKECLLEILQEGLGVRTDHTSKAFNRTKRSDRAVKSAGLDKIHFHKENLQENSNFNKNIENTAKSLTSDPVLSSIFEDTARTTLQEQIGADRTGPGGVSLPSAAAGDSAARIASQNSPEDLFSESAGKWAHLAFAEQIPSK